MVTFESLTRALDAFVRNLEATGTAEYRHHAAACLGTARAALEDLAMQLQRVADGRTAGVVFPSPLEVIEGVVGDLGGYAPTFYKGTDFTLALIIEDLAILAGDSVGDSSDTVRSVAGRAAGRALHLSDMLDRSTRKTIDLPDLDDVRFALIAMGSPAADGISLEAECNA